MADPSAEERRRLASQGRALPGRDGGPGRFPIRNRDDLDRAIQAVGRVRPNTEQARAKVRRFIIRRARELGLASMIPDSWASDGSLKG
ncbi:MAG: hypothetical protein GEV12_14280 [Micromonosporaceae bacterium]|nr:hypothetical protein [Micromonosporaceae bacterium]